MGPTPFLTELGPKKTPKADFAMKQTNICRLSGDIKNITSILQDLPLLPYGRPKNAENTRFRR